LELKIESFKTEFEKLQFKIIIYENKIGKLENDNLMLQNQQELRIRLEFKLKKDNKTLGKIELYLCMYLLT
jgi:hypothetical protein